MQKARNATKKFCISSNISVLAKRSVIVISYSLVYASIRTVTSIKWPQLWRRVENISKSCGHQLYFPQLSYIFIDAFYYSLLFWHYRTDIPKEKSAPTVHYGLEEIVTAAFASDENVLVANNFGTIKVN